MSDNPELSRRMRAASRTQRRELAAALENGPTRRVVRRLLDVCGLFAPHMDERGEGRRDVALALVAEMNEVDPSIFVDLMREGANEMTRARARSKHAGGTDDDDEL